MAGLFHINLNVAELLGLEQKFTPAVEQAMKDAVRDLSAMTMAHVKELAQRHLRSTRETYLEALSTEQDEGGEVWLINLDMTKAGWIENGRKAGEMIQDLLKSKKIGSNGKPWVKTAKDGSKYASVPFVHNRGATNQTPEQLDLADAIKSEMKKRKISFGGIEKDKDGSAKQGLLHTFNVPTPVKTKNGPGQGWGPVGAPRQGATGVPFLQGVQVHQKKVDGLDPKTGQKIKKTVKAIVTYRVVSSKQMGSGRWHHPGIEPSFFIDYSYEYALEQLEQVIKPRVIQSIVDAL